MDTGKGALVPVNLSLGKPLLATRPTVYQDIKLHKTLGCSVCIVEYSYWNPFT